MTRVKGSSTEDGTSVGSKHGRHSGGTKRRAAQYARVKIRARMRPRRKGNANA